jgi:IS605 OrfB family transposase
MKLVEKHIIKKTHSLFKECDRLAFLSKNLYNAANYIIRQEFIKNNKYLNYNVINKAMLKDNNHDYRQLPAKVSNGILRLLDKNWISFFKAIKDYKKHPKKYLGRPKIPKYKDKLNGRNVLPYEKGAISKRILNKENKIKLSNAEIIINTNVNYENLKAARIVPKIDHYVVEIIYLKEVDIDVSKDLNYDNKAGIDVGVNNFASIGASTGDSFIINGRPLKSINQYYNKIKAKLQLQLKSGQYSSYRINKLTNKRNNRINDYLHKSSRKIIDYCLANHIGKIIIGKNLYWKQDINLGDKNNQNFVGIPFARFIEMIKYKAKLVGIDVIINEESYTSKCSFIDNESLEHHDKYLGRRVKRGLFKSAEGIKVNADINGAFNIIRKVFPLFSVNDLKYGIKDVAVHPLMVNPLENLKVITKV